MVFKEVLQPLLSKWNAYKYRFVPWIAVNVGKNQRTLRFVPEEAQDKIISDDEVLNSLHRLFRGLFIRDLERQNDVFRLLPEPIKSDYRESASFTKKNLLLHGAHCEWENEVEYKCSFNPKGAMFEELGFAIGRAPSSLKSAGTGVFIIKGSVQKGAVVSMYPGTVYQQHEPVLFQSIGNPFIFRCIDGVLIDGNDRGVSKIIYRSCSGRDRLGPCKLSDDTWLSPFPVNPLAVGQYVNNCSNEREANVCYQEFDVPAHFPLHFRQYLPNVSYMHDIERIHILLKSVINYILPYFHCQDFIQ
ncbi:SET domain-containing protein 9 isoform X2 [Protopterus annectens]|uniref:SET domain-containing protein 9 isoform X2 n=1 Tax=Protopterus annectens TaxID=7888 RepID=UPI001CF9DB24|nr:SET domain-containing protein 9 isoform X2 [Protopterus annectens]